MYWSNIHGIIFIVIPINKGSLSKNKLPIKFRIHLKYRQYGHVCVGLCGPAANVSVLSQTAESGRTSQLGSGYT